MAATGSGIKITVVIPAYNAARFLPRCLESVFAQTLKPDEVIVVDDGSTDNTAALAAELGARILRRSNSGSAAARNAGIANASAEWVALLDADDCWVPEKLERQADCIQSDTVLVYTGIRFFDDHGSRGEKPAIDPVTATKMLRYCNPITPSTVLARREILMRDGGFREDIRVCEDWEMWFRLQRQGQFEAVPEALTNYYIYPGSLSANPQKMLSALDGFIETTLLADLKGVKRWVWRCRILATQLCSAGLIARDNGLGSDLRYFFQSLCAWPSPFWEPRRFAMLAVSARNRLNRHKR
jgi:glycosyltransferase involved in cell wall biosynthesis